MSSPPERRATWFELFSDLVFVAAVSQVTHRIDGHPSAGSVAAAAALFVPVWWAWVLYAVRANRLAADDPMHRIVTMAGLGGVVGMAVFLPHVGDGTDAGFVLSYLATRAAILVLYVLAARRDPVFTPILRTFATGSSLAAVLWLAGLGLPFRYGFWAAAMAVELLMPVIAARRTSRASHDADHLRERFGLFTIIVLGESVLAFTNGLIRAHISATAAITAALAFAFVACLWWTYFNTSGTRHGAHDALTTSPRHRDAFIFGHLPIQLGLAVTAGTLSTVVADAHVATSVRLCLIGAAALYLLFTALVRAAFTGLREGVVLVRLVAVAVLLALLPAAGAVSVPILLAALTAVLAAAILLETPLHRRLLLPASAS